MLKRQTETLRHLLSFLLALILLSGSGLNIYTSEAELPESGSASTIPSESVGESPESENLPSSTPDNSASIPESMLADPSSIFDSSTSVSESLPEDPSSVVSDSFLPEENSSAPPEIPELAPDPEMEETDFVPLEILDFLPLVETEFGQEITLQVKLNRDDVAVSYQWQMIPPVPVCKFEGGD